MEITPRTDEFPATLARSPTFAVHKLLMTFPHILELQSQLVAFFFAFRVRFFAALVSVSAYTPAPRRLFCRAVLEFFFAI
jgi:hypothetical protein